MAPVAGLRGDRALAASRGRRAEGGLKRYLELLAVTDFRRLWLGSTVSILGDGATWIALSWLVYSRTNSPEQVGALLFAYGAPVLVGGLLTGPLLDRFGPRQVMIVDSLARAAVMAAVPLTAAVGSVPLWALYAVACSYGLLKMVPLAGVPSLLPSLVPAERLNTANAMESLSYGLGGIAAPLLAGALIPLIGAVNVLAVDSVTFLIFAVALTRIRKEAARVAGNAESYALRDAFRFFRTSRPIALTTVMFALANVGIGALLVLLPVYAKEVLEGGATTYALLASSLVAGDVIGSFVVGALDWRLPLGRSIAAAQAAVGVGLLPLVTEPGAAGAVFLLALAGFLASPLTIWAQSLRMRLIPAELRGRVFSLLRTMMQAAEPLGGAGGGAAIGWLGLAPTVVGIAGVIALPGLFGLRHPALRNVSESSPDADVVSLSGR